MLLSQPEIAVLPYRSRISRAKGKVSVEHLPAPLRHPDTKVLTVGNRTEQPGHRQGGLEGLKERGAHVLLDHMLSPADIGWK